MAVVLFHIPRTSGSSVWKNLARLAGASGLAAFDLYGHARELTGSPYKTSEALADLLVRQPGVERGVVHHHTRRNITGMLPPGRHHYVTIVRDPVQRFVSEIFHLRAFVRRGRNFFSPERRYLRQLLTRPARAALLRRVMCPDELLLRVAEEPFYRDYYINSFWELMYGDDAASSAPFQCVGAEVAPRLAASVRVAFSHIGRFAEVEASVGAIAALASLPGSAQAVVRVENGVPKPALRPETVARLRAMNAADYRFLDMIAVSPGASSATGLAGAEAETSFSRP